MHQLERPLECIQNPVCSVLLSLFKRVHCFISNIGDQHTLQRRRFLTSVFFKLHHSSKVPSLNKEKLAPAALMSASWFSGHRCLTEASFCRPLMHFYNFCQMQSTIVVTFHAGSPVQQQQQQILSVAIYLFHEVTISQNWNKTAFMFFLVGKRVVSGTYPVVLFVFLLC